MAKIKGQSGKSRYTKIVSYRLENSTHKAISKLAGGKKMINKFLKSKAEELV